MPEKLSRIFSMVCLFMLLVPMVAFADDQGKLIAKGKGIDATREEVDLLKSRVQSYFKTTETEYCRALIKMKLFAREAREQGMDLEREIALELNQMVYQKLSAIYVNRLLEKYEMLPGTIESYYYSHGDEFRDDTGNVMALDHALRKKIGDKIMLRKKSELANREMDRLIKKYQVDIMDPGCIKKE